MTDRTHQDCVIDFVNKRFKSDFPAATTNHAAEIIARLTPNDLLDLRALAVNCEDSHFNKTRDDSDP